MDKRKPTNEQKGQYRKYDSDSLTSAYIAVRKDGMSVRKAAKVYGVPYSTLQDRTRGNVSLDVVRSGPAPLFTQEQEVVLTNHMKTMAEVKKPRALDVARAKSATRQEVDNYFYQLQHILVKYNLEGKPHFIYNIDEKALNPEHKPPKIVAGKLNKTMAVTSGRNKIVTLIGCVNAVGQVIPPFFVFPGARMLENLLDGASPGAAGTVTHNGWSNTEVFIKYMQEHLLPYLPNRDDSHVLILYDGHSTHVSLGLIDWAKSQKTISFVLPPHCSHLLQPLDLGCFGPFQIAWNAACHRYLQESGGCIVTRYDVCRIACGVYNSTLSVANITTSFKKSGIYPYNANAIVDTQVAPATSFSRTSTTNIHGKETEMHSIEKFFNDKGGKILENVEKAKKARNTLSKVVGGKPITEDDIVDKIKEHNAKKTQKQSKSKTNEKENLETKKQVLKGKKGHLILSQYHQHQDHQASLKKDLSPLF